MACGWTALRFLELGPSMSSREGMNRMVKATPTRRGCSGRSGQTSNRVMLRSPRRFSTPVSVDVPTLARASRRSDDRVMECLPRFGCLDFRATLADNRANMRVEILCTGDEILSGKTINTNYSHMARRLGEIG